MIIPQNSRVELVLVIDAKNTETVNEYFEVEVKQSHSLFFQVMAEIQRP